MSHAAICMQRRNLIQSEMEKRGPSGPCTWSQGPPPRVPPQPLCEQVPLWAEFTFLQMPSLCWQQRGRPRAWPPPGLGLPTCIPFPFQEGSSFRKEEPARTVPRGDSRGFHIEGSSVTPEGSGLAFQREAAPRSRDGRQEGCADLGVLRSLEPGALPPNQSRVLSSEVQEGAGREQTSRLVVVLTVTRLLGRLRGVERGGRRQDMGKLSCRWRHHTRDSVFPVILECNYAKVKRKTSEFAFKAFPHG